jgi:Protein of unknown function (DUF3300)
METMKSESSISLNAITRPTIALTLSLLLVPAAQLNLFGQAPAPAYVELDATQLDQLVAPIALDPDSLVAQILTGSTYPDQIAAADAWLNQNINLPPAQRAAGANVQPWDPAIKGLIEFPLALDNLAKNTAWAAQLGNAYYNQPGDVENAIQAMRLQAQQSKVLVSTPQETVSVADAGVITIAPVNPAVVYVPYYNPWAIWGGLFAPYPGFVVVAPPVGVVVGVGLAYTAGVPVAAFAGFDWGFSAWAPAWTGGTVLFGGNTYISSSTTVINHGNFGGHDRGAFDHGGRGVPGGFHAAARVGAARARAAADRSRAAQHASAARHSAPAQHSSAARNSAPRNSASAKRTASANHTTTSHPATSANHTASANHSAASHSAASHSTAPANHTASASHSASSHSAASHAGPSANHSAAHSASVAHSSGGGRTSHK